MDSKHGEPRHIPSYAGTLRNHMVTVPPSIRRAGGIVVFSALYVQIAFSPPIWAMLAVALPLVAALSLGLMRPGKGVMIALQMRNDVRHD